jgi:putative nucleotidyltransferase with HDIG domain
VSDAAPRFTRRRVVLLGLVLAAALVAVLFPWFPGTEGLTEGVPAPRTVAAPREARFESAALTAARRETAAAAVPEVFLLDPGVRDTQQSTLVRQLKDIDYARRDRVIADSARESEIRAIEGVVLSSRAAAAFGAADDASWEALAEQARNALDRTLTGAVTADDLQGARTRAAGFLSSLLTAQRLALTELLNPLVVPTLVVNRERTELLREEARAAQPVVVVTYARGEPVVTEGQPITAAQLEALEALDLVTTGVRAESVAATVLVALLAAAALGGYLLVEQPVSMAGVRRLALLGLLLLVPALVAKFGLPLVLPDEQRHFLAHALPLAAAPMAAAVLLDVPIAILLAALIAAITSLVALELPGVEGGGVATPVEAMRLSLAVLATSLAGILPAAHAERQQRYLMAGLAAAGAGAAAVLITWLLDAERERVDLLWIAATTSVGGVLAALLAVGTFGVLARPFGIVTRVELMELAQLNNPLLRRLQDEAPGTFQHSVLVGNLAERAADRIGANPLVARVGAYYHDVGKLVAPGFFVENQSGESPHEGLDPLQSTRVIQQHVTGGVEIARKAGLPEAIVQFIPQHHGTRLVAYFYRRAAEVNSGIDPELFRYPGPRPRSRETALVMLADGCEATVRASADHSPARIREIVEGIVRERIEEGQFDDCPISLRDLRITGDSFVSALAAVFHPRVEYPQPTDRERAERHVPPPPASGEDGLATAPTAPASPPAAPPAPAPTAPRRERGEDDS